MPLESVATDNVRRAVILFPLLKPSGRSGKLCTCWWTLPYFYSKYYDTLFLSMFLQFELFVLHLLPQLKKARFLG